MKNYNSLGSTSWLLEAVGKFPICALTKLVSLHFWGGWGWGVENSHIRHVSCLVFWGWPVGTKHSSSWVSHHVGHEDWVTRSHSWAEHLQLKPRWRVTVCKGGTGGGWWGHLDALTARWQEMGLASLLTCWATLGRWSQHDLIPESVQVLWELTPLHLLRESLLIHSGLSVHPGDALCSWGYLCGRWDKPSCLPTHAFTRSPCRLRVRYQRARNAPKMRHWGKLGKRPWGQTSHTGYLAQHLPSCVTTCKSLNFSEAPFPHV